MAKIDAAKPEYLDRKGFLCLLLDQALDSAATLGAPDGTEGATSTSNLYIPKSINTNNKSKGRKQGKTADLYPDDFLAFWKTYQSLPVKASKQSKPLALEAWKEATATSQPSAIQAAIEKQINIQHEELRTERGFTVSMPDCFRWLRDGCYHALMEDNAPAVSDKPSWML
jgi:hypothetical protein